MPTNKNEKLISKLHERLMNKFMKQISKSINKIQKPIVDIKPDVRKNDPEPVPTIKGAPEPPRGEHGGADKINDIRNEVGATQPSGALNPDKQNELMEIVKRRYEEFERELHHIASEDKGMVQSASQKFKNELLENAHKKTHRIEILFRANYVPCR